MANFLPLKQYLHYCIDKLIDEYALKPEFLDIGCGIGDVSSFLAEKGWRGKAIDVSTEALEKAKQHLAAYPGVTLEKMDFFEADGTYNTVFLLDILEHIPEDERALGKLASLLANLGHAVIAVPSNPRYWHWDDDFYGHVRRYTADEIRKKLKAAGLETVTILDFTFPVFWLMRQIYTGIKKGRKENNGSGTLQKRTLQSGMAPEWQNSVLIEWIGRASFFWRLIYWVQYNFFRNNIGSGHEFIVLAKKLEI